MDNPTGEVHGRRSNNGDVWGDVDSNY
uniref:Uncharacterized protein n=1 Tax=Nelumbo nucifera TaxID=4432 RepID=A0A822ZVT5_NELNU|nr:TPA_asm: hypothetical protein HUJ06_018547 [Nelumbo nucifera]